MFTVYVITGPDGREYVGCTGQSLDVRFRNHVACPPSQFGPDSIAAAIRTHGADAFTITAIATGLSYDDAANAEREAIIQRGTRYPAGYNLRVGGAGFGRSRWHPKRLVA